MVVFFTGVFRTTCVTEEAVEVTVLEMVPSAAVMCRGIMLDQ